MCANISTSFHFLKDVFLKCNLIFIRTWNKTFKNSQQLFQSLQLRAWRKAARQTVDLPQTLAAPLRNRTQVRILCAGRAPILLRADCALVDELWCESRRRTETFCICSRHTSEQRASMTWSHPHPAPTHANHCQEEGAGKCAASIPFGVAEVFGHQSAWDASLPAALLRAAPFEKRVSVGSSGEGGKIRDVTFNS